jgi:hypothetical protein
MRIHRHLTFANICSALALTVALSTGTAYAASTVFSADIVDGEVRTPDFGAAAVTAPKIAAGAVRSAAVRDGSLADDVVVVSPGAALPAGIVVAGASVASSTQVRATLCNLSGTTQPQITDLPVRVLTLR